MKKVSYYLSVAASVMLATVMSVGLTACSTKDTPVDNTPKEPEQAKVIIKEIAIGGGFKTTEGKSYGWCKVITLYNNSGVKATFKNLAIGAVPPGNAHANFSSLDGNGNLIYENADWLPVWATVWYIPEITIEPYSDAVIAVNGAIDHTQLAPDAYNLANASYYVMYDPESGMNNANAYPAPYEGIPVANYWKGIMFGTGNAWAVSIMCPALVLFQFPEGTDIPTFCANANNIWYNGKEGVANACVKIQQSWILDGTEFYRIGFEADSHKRLPAGIDAGFGIYNSNKMYSAYRNVDKAATEALAENAGKLVYGYTNAVEGTSDPSDIDAAASVKNGAKIIYLDTNNSTDDFHVRKDWSLK